MRKAIRTGLFIGVSTSSLILFIIRFVKLTPILFIIILYLYAGVGVLTAFFVYRQIKRENNPERNRFPKRVFTKILDDTDKIRDLLKTDKTLFILDKNTGFLIDRAISNIDHKLVFIEEELANMNTR